MKRAEALRQALKTLRDWNLLDELTVHGGFALREFHGGIRCNEDLDLRFNGKVDSGLCDKLRKRIQCGGGAIDRSGSDGLIACMLVSRPSDTHRVVKLDVAEGRPCGWTERPLPDTDICCRVATEQAIVSGQAITLFRARTKGKCFSKAIWDIAFHTLRTPSLNICKREIEWRVKNYGSKPLKRERCICALLPDHRLRFGEWMGSNHLVLPEGDSLEAAMKRVERYLAKVRDVVP